MLVFVNMICHIVYLFFRHFDDDQGALSGAVHSAIMDNNYKRLRLIIDVILRIKIYKFAQLNEFKKAGFAIDVRNHHNLTPLHLACSR